MIYGCLNLKISKWNQLKWYQKSPKDLRLICRPTLDPPSIQLVICIFTKWKTFFFFPGSGILNPFCWCFSVRFFFFSNIRVCLLFLSLKLYVFIFTGKWVVFYLLVEKHIQKKNENFTIFTCWIWTKSQSVENKILSLTMSWSVNFKKKSKGGKCSQSCCIYSIYNCTYLETTIRLPFIIKSLT